MIKMIIRDLFGTFNYDISLCEKGMSILTGANGFGKSTIIKCIKALGESDIYFFWKLKFKYFELQNEYENSTIKIEKKDDDIYINEHYIDKDIIDYIRKKRTRRVLRDEIKNNADIYEIMQNMKSAVGNVEYIEEQRLVTAKEGDRYYRSGSLNRSINMPIEIIQVVTQIPEKMDDILQQVSLEYSRIANVLDSTFPIRLFKENDGIDQKEFEMHMDDMQVKLRKMEEYGITNISKLEKIQFKEEDARALKVYFSDFEQKYNIYKSLIQKLDLYIGMVNERLRFKKVCISMEKGFSVIDKDGNKIALSDLSSGEKEVLVLFFRLLFDVKDNSLLLIDEPEISLHIAWQRMFAKDIKKIMELKNLKVIIATHSVQIVNGNYDIQVDLGECYKRWIQLEKTKN